MPSLPFLPGQVYGQLALYNGLIGSDVFHLNV